MVLSLLVFGCAHTQAPAAAPAPAPAAVAWPEGAFCGLNTDGSKLSSVLRIVSMQCGVTFDVHDDVAEHPVTVALEDAPCAEAVAAIGASAGVAIEATSSTTLSVTTQPD